ncbi:hypothetical protein EJ05DRAFT_269188 [Pseudovirgaria hyperparasitica]|uniref:Alpha/beta hydrolase fold-3 domain-containing protein n=1 Tax=Pseudovirgaria hyperparasitica TaxID=470096 RepID=A0A6A6VR43_9PEZI|nr:uncharacterized protein EJ05DRAFT_269188 [Pseudovirgaria hyperparasitica]KAF2752673.1 hypothetical protein EJ05DRAFT_269188 [Pseudovirgaria hyperparasitica]
MRHVWIPCILFKEGPHTENDDLRDPDIILAEHKRRTHQPLSPNCEKVELPGFPVPVLRYRPENAVYTGFLVVGGGGVYDNSHLHSKYHAHMANSLMCELLVPQYRSAVQEPFPASQKDISAALDCFLDLFRGRKTILIGESFGGSLLHNALCWTRCDIESTSRLEEKDEDRNADRFLAFFDIINPNQEAES